MANVTLQMDEAAIREATVQALMGKLTPEFQAKLIQDAIQSILTRDRGSYSTDPTPIEQAFCDAVYTQANRIARETVEQDAAVQAKLRELMADTMARMLTHTDEAARTAFVDRMAQAFVNTLRRD